MRPCNCKAHCEVRDSEARGAAPISCILRIALQRRSALHSFIYGYQRVNTHFNTCPLDELSDSEEATVVEVRSSDGALPADLLRRLIEIGFLPGERVRIMARGALGGTPLAVRVGTSTFALRQAEARCIQVAPLRAEIRV